MQHKTELALGTVQFGLKYGIAGRGECVPEDEVRLLLQNAWNSGIRLLDTAGAYGNIEQRLLGLTGNLDFQIVSKIPQIPRTLNAQDSFEFIRRSILSSRERLQSKLVALLFHDTNDVYGEVGRLRWQVAEDAISGTAIRLGVSSYSPDSAIELRRNLPISILQVPGNAFDQRLTTCSDGAQLNRMEIHLRSAFLQGLLLQSPDRAASLVQGASKPMNAWIDWCNARSLTPLQGALCAVKSFENIRYCVVGVDNLQQLNSIIGSWSVARPMDISTLAVADESIIDPRKWKRQ